MSKQASMKVWSEIVLLTVLGFAVAKSASAATLISLPLWATPPADNLACVVLNVGKKPITTVTVVLAGGAAGSTTCTNLDVGGAPCTILATAPTSGAPAYCTATFSGSKSNVRGSLLLFDGNTARVMVAVPLN